MVSLIPTLTGCIVAIFRILVAPRSAQQQRDTNPKALKDAQFGHWNSDVPCRSDSA